MHVVSYAPPSSSIIFCPTRALVHYFSLKLGAQPDHGGIRRRWSAPIVATTFEKGLWEVQRNPEYLKTYEDFVIVEPVRDSVRKLIRILPRKPVFVSTTPESVTEVHCSNRIERDLQVLRNVREGTVVYVGSYKEAWRIAREIREKLVRRVAVYRPNKPEIVQYFIEGDYEIVVATRAFNVPSERAIVLTDYTPMAREVVKIVTKTLCPPKLETSPFFIRR